MLRDVALVAAQTHDDAGRFLELGLPEAAVRITGSLKFDMQLAKHMAAQIEACRRDCAAPRPIWIAASTHADEERVVLAAHEQVLREHATALLVLAPRHPGRAAEIVALMKQHRFAYRQRSHGETCTQDTAVYLLDTLGELQPFYGAADVAFVGGSLAPIGGHNLIEPAAVGVPIVTGPHVFNFAEVSRLLTEAGAASVVTDASSLAWELTLLLRDADLRARRGQSGRAMVQAHSGAVGRLLALMEPMLKQQGERQVAPSAVV
jgi:3-deoxy-D-manno-octulosonic-acid transferase